jgi:hypothetical protein
LEKICMYVLVMFCECATKVCKSVPFAFRHINQPVNLYTSIPASASTAIVKNGRMVKS